jgi:hypothetical protein
VIEFRMRADGCVNHTIQSVTFSFVESLKQLHDRLRDDPAAHLGRKSVHLIMAYELGYELGQRRWGAPVLRLDVGSRAMQEWVEKKFGWTAEMGCRQNAVSFASLMSVDEQSAFDFYFEMRDAAARELESAESTDTDLMQFPRSELLEFINSDHFRQRPGMWMGRKSLDDLWALCNGYLWAEMDMGIAVSAARDFASQFQQWIEDRYPFAKGRPWNKVLDFLTLSSPDRAWASFYDALDGFLAGQKPDSLSKTGEQMLQAITRKILASDPDADADEIALKFKETVKRICPG